MSVRLLKKCALSVSLLLGCAASADQIQVSLAPVPSYSTLNGFSLGLKVGGGYKVTDKWQATADAYFLSQADHTFKGFEVGAVYNNDPKLLRSWFAGGGVGVTDQFNNAGVTSGLIYARGGYRWLLSDAYQISYSPYVEPRFSQNTVIVDIEFANFSMTF